MKETNVHANVAWFRKKPGDVLRRAAVLGPIHSGKTGFGSELMRRGLGGHSSFEIVGFFPKDGKLFFKSRPGDKYPAYVDVMNSFKRRGLNRPAFDEFQGSFDPEIGLTVGELPIDFVVLMHASPANSGEVELSEAGKEDVEEWIGLMNRAGVEKVSRSAEYVRDAHKECRGKTRFFLAKIPSHPSGVSPAHVESVVDSFLEKVEEIDGE